MPSFRRQAIVLKIAYCHAIMHANRLFLLSSPRPDSDPQITECLEAARTVFEVVDGIAREGPIFHAFWWTQYVTFSALVVSYVWDRQLRRRGTVLTSERRSLHIRLMALARKCQNHMSNIPGQDSPGRRYAVILEEFCSEVGDPIGATKMTMQGFQDRADLPTDGPLSHTCRRSGDDLTESTEMNLLDMWSTTDWLDLDSSAFGPRMNLDMSLWTPDLGIL